MRVLLAAGALMSAGYACFLPFEPLRRHVPPFLLGYALLFALFIAVIQWIKKILSLDTENAGRSAASWWKARPTAGGKSGLAESMPYLLCLLFFSLVFRFIMIQTAPSLSDDIFRYVWDGRVQQAGINPYAYPPSAPELYSLRDAAHGLINHRDVRTIYPPLTQWVYRLGVAINPTIGTQRLLFLVFDMGTVVLLMALLIMRGRSPLWSVIYAWNPLVVVEFAGSGHNDGLMLFLLLGGFLFWETRKPALSVAAFAASTLAKLIPIVMIPWILLQRRWRGILLYGVIVAAACLPFIPGFQFPSFHQPSLSGVKTFARDWMFNPSLYGFLGAFGLAPTWRKIVMGMLLTAFAFWWARKTKEDPLRYAFGALFALLLAGPVVHPWYVIWLIPFLCFYPLWSGLVWVGLVPLTYIVLIQYERTGVWRLAPWVMIMEYTVVYLLLAAEFVKRIVKNRAPQRAGTIETKPKARLRVSLIIPALNEEKAIRQVIDEIPKSVVDKIIVVDNGSTDNTARAAREAGALVVTQAERGYGRAVLRGLQELPADTDTVVILDGDHSDFPEDLPKLLLPIQEGRADLVIGSRSEAALPGSLMPQQRFGNWLTCVLLQFLFDRRFTDMGPFRAIRRETLETLRMEDPTFGWNVEMQAKALRHGYRIAEVPVRYRPRIGTSKISGTIKGSFKAGVIILWSIYRYGVKRLENDAFLMTNAK